VGSPNAVLQVYGGDPRIERTLRRALGGRVPAGGLGGGSDHAPFRRAGIPVGGIFTGASEDGPGGRPRDPCYHRRCDTADNVDRGVLLRTARAAAEALAELQAK
jgi:aminopeptidase S